jgi:hypothetical protein
MSRAVETIEKIFDEWKSCPILSAIDDCGKCPYIEVPEDECEKVAQEEIKRVIDKLKADDLP